MRDLDDRAPSAVSIWASAGNAKLGQALAVARLAGGTDDDGRLGSAWASSTSTTSATTQVTLSGAPASSAASTSAVTAAVGSARASSSCDARVGDVAAQAVAADEVAVADARLAHRDVGLGRVDAVDRAHERGCGAGGRSASSAVMRPGVDEGLDVGVVAGDLGELAVAQQVGARVADVQHRDARRARRRARPAR